MASIASTGSAWSHAISGSGERGNMARRDYAKGMVKRKRPTDAGRKKQKGPFKRKRPRRGGAV
ncbi:hypothetical protein TMPK1_25580 [Rhodospirillales bacterium TMPK1]|uniref:Uncharacterized protein n=1 Tax=Roseiterribacter gracilis TaxID=2812848 RepID=A0A8S8XEJ5_9PROT|nr:hypothetical protein TMPK1_25580 [Rhodospirillales bacterium TMPK1]